MKKFLLISLLLVLTASCTSAETLRSIPIIDATNTADPPEPTSLPPTPDPIAEWTEFNNTELGYSFMYPAECSFGPMGADCKQKPPEERSPECLCFLNAEDPNMVFMQNFLGDPEQGLTLVTFTVQHFDTLAYNPPEGEAWIPWLSNYWSHLSDELPGEPNLNLGGRPGVRIYIPGSPQSYAAENIFVLMKGKLVKIEMIDVDVEQHLEFYDNILASFKISE
jgi:hypothetical protein